MWKWFVIQECFVLLLFLPRHMSKPDWNVHWVWVCAKEHKAHMFYMLHTLHGHIVTLWGLTLWSLSASVCLQEEKCIGQVFGSCTKSMCAIKHAFARGKQTPQAGKIRFLLDFHIMSQLSDLTLSEEGTLLHSYWLLEGRWGGDIDTVMCRPACVAGGELIRKYLTSILTYTNFIFHY